MKIRLCGTFIISLWAMLIIGISLTGVANAESQAATPAAFIKCPENITTYMGLAASFTCDIDLGNCDGIFWYATEANTPHYVLPPEYEAVARTKKLPSNILSSTLTIKALKVTDNIKVTCKGDRVFGQDIFSAAYMTVTETDELSNPVTSSSEIMSISLAAVVTVCLSHHTLVD